MTEEQAAKNTDRELWRETPGDAYAPSIFVTENGGIGINVGGYIIVRNVRDWHAGDVKVEQQYQADVVELTETIESLRAEVERLKAENERLNKLFYLSEPEGKIILRQSNEIERLREQLVSLQSSLDSATKLYAAAMNLRR